MTRSFGTLVVIVLALAALAACGRGEEPEPLEAARPEKLETGPDPAVVDPDHYAVEFENDRVRVLRITYGPGEESVMHHHPDLAAVFLSDHHVSFGLPDGSSEEAHHDAGGHVFAPAGQHLPKNIGEEPVELIAVELKAGESAAVPAETVDPTAADPDHYSVEFENDRVRFVRITYGPGEESVLHHHPDAVAVSLTDGHWSMGAADGSSEEIHTEAGSHLFMPATQHLPKNIGAEPAELILVELK